MTEKPADSVLVHGYEKEDGRIVHVYHSHTTGQEYNEIQPSKWHDEHPEAIKD